MLNQLVRYAPLLRLLRGEPGTLLEVGSGADGIASYLRRRAFGLEIDFGGPPGEWLIPVRGTATHLPFADRSVDTVLIMDTMEHIPPPLRRAALDEAMRVARARVVVGGPMGPRARAADVALAAHYEKRGLELPSWLREHLQERAPDVEDVAEPFRESGWDVRVEGNENVRAHVGLLKFETTWFGFRAANRLRQYAAGPVAALARAARVGPYYSWLVFATRRSQDADTRATNGSQS